MANITLPPMNTAVATNNTATFNGTPATANLQTGFTAQNTFGSGATNFKALGSPDQVGSSMQQLTSVIDALTKVVEALGQIVAALKGGGAENAKAPPPAGGGAEAAKPADKPA